MYVQQKKHDMGLSFDLNAQHDVTHTMNTNMLQLIQDNLNHIEQLRHNNSASREDILDDMRQREILLIKKLVHTANTAHFILPINAYDQNDAFLLEGVSAMGHSTQLD
jgi:hypothetical protein